MDFKTKATATTFVPFHVNMIICQDFNLPHTYNFIFLNFFCDMKIIKIFELFKDDSIMWKHMV